MRVFSKEHREKIVESNRRRGQLWREQRKIHGFTCTDCKEIKQESEFHKRNGEVTTYICKDCWRTRYKVWVTRDGNRDKIKQSKYKRYTQWLVILKEKSMLSCSKCGYSDNYSALDYHHVDPATKEIGIGYIINRIPTDTLIAELDKCICLCSNCHREYHHPEYNRDNFNV